jgi:hypothetical protein
LTKHRFNIQTKNEATKSGDEVLRWDSRKCEYKDGFHIKKKIVGGAKMYQRQEIAHYRTWSLDCLQNKD